MLNTGSILCNKIEKHVPLKYLAVGPWQRRHDPWGPQESPSLPAANGTVKNNIVQLWSMPECSLLPLAWALSPAIKLLYLLDLQSSPSLILRHQHRHLVYFCIKHRPLWSQDWNSLSKIPQHLELSWEWDTEPVRAVKVRMSDVGEHFARRCHFTTRPKVNIANIFEQSVGLHEWAKVFRGNNWVWGAQNISWRNYFQLFDTGTLRMLQPESYRIYRVVFLTGPP